MQFEKIRQYEKAINDFKKSRNIEYERMIQRHKNKLKDLEKQQKTELNFLTKKSKI